MLPDTISPCLAKSMHLGMISGLLVIFFPPLFILHFIFINFFVGDAVKMKLWLEETTLIKPPPAKPSWKAAAIPTHKLQHRLEFPVLKTLKSQSQVPNTFTFHFWGGGKRTDPRFAALCCRGSSPFSPHSQNPTVLPKKDAAQSKMKDFHLQHPDASPSIPIPACWLKRRTCPSTRNAGSAPHESGMPGI